MHGMGRNHPDRHRCRQMTTEGASEMVSWDIDRYEALQDSAWEHDRSAGEEDSAAKREGRSSNGPAGRSRAGALRIEAAQLLARYWAPRLPDSSAGLVRRSG